MDVKLWYNSLSSKEKASYVQGLQGLSGNKSEADFNIHSKSKVNGFQSALDSELGHAEELEDNDQ